MVLHVIDGGFRGLPGGFKSELEMRARGCALLCSRLRHPQRVVLTGPGARVEHASLAGLRIDSRIAPPLGNPAGAWLALRRLVQAEGRPDAVICWGCDAARLAHRALGEAVPRIVVAPEGDAMPDCAHIVVHSESARRRLVDAGGAEGSVTSAPPPVEVRRPCEQERRRLRALFGCPADSIVVVAVGPPRRVDAVRFAFTIGLLAVAGVRVTGLLGRDAPQIGRADRLCAAEPLLRIIESNRPASELAVGADLAVFAGGGSSPTSNELPRPWLAATPIMAAHAAGVPVVAPAWVNVDGLYPRGAAPHLLANNSTLPELARKAADLIEHEGVRRACADAVFRDAVERDSAGGFVAKVGEILDSVIDEAGVAEASA